MRLGSIIPGLRAVSEQGDLYALLLDCIERDNARALRQLFAVEGIEGSFPALIGFAVQNNAMKCYDILKPSLFVPRDLENFRAGDLSKEMLRRLLQDKILDPNMWVKQDREAECNNYVYPWTVYWQPILSALIEARNFECAHVLLDSGPRLDVCEWEAQSPDPDALPDPNETDDPDYLFHMWNDGFSFPGKTPLHTLVLTLKPGSMGMDGPPPEDGLRLLRRMTVLAKEKGCIDWTATVPEKALIPYAFTFDEKEIQYELSPFQFACGSLQPVLGDTFIEAGASVRGGISRGGISKESPLRLSTLVFSRLRDNWVEFREGSLESRCIGVLRSLSQCGVDLNPEVKRVSDVQALPLYVALSKGFKRVFDFLVKEKGLIVRDSYRGFSPLLLCIQNHEWPLATALLDSPHNLDPNREGKLERRGILFSDEKKVTLMSPLCASVVVWKYFLNWNNTQLAEASAAFCKMLVEKGARCDSVETGGEKETEEGEGDEVAESEEDVPPRSDLSPLVIACSRPSCPQTAAASVESTCSMIRLLVEKARADPNLAGRLKEGRSPSNPPLYPLLSALCSTDGERLKEGEVYSKAYTGRVMETLLQVGASPELVLQTFPQEEDMQVDG
uniref:Uncharacterized protein n=1 Tax=Chromera velia CCMP2878 TaxID=1169474 RepID=A0A0G4FQF7_9ALVE|eukprot:Cvel_18169.t1-p1 / transcript=Cvel_18169.t1 / gene=Cvel_18169 / organism=Chromera_velia_CCMP2878 / gene_product=hypothetical protein / transcript_product=hypothetical protein / location=Cvel_scaffold1490:16626-19255(-) / protein_length=616 / sequence_SO=supercontig / SO=protein_coding / is_pseudo=false